MLCSVSYTHIYIAHWLGFYYILCKFVHKPGAGANPHWWAADNICSQQNPAVGQVQLALQPRGEARSAEWSQNHFPWLQEKVGSQGGFLGYTQVTLQISCISPIKVLKATGDFRLSAAPRVSESVGGTQGVCVPKPREQPGEGRGAATLNPLPSTFWVTSTRGAGASLFRTDPRS